MNGSIGGLLDYSRDEACISHMRELEAVAASSSNPRDIQLVVHLFSSQHTGSYTAQHYLKFKVCRRIW